MQYNIPEALRERKANLENIAGAAEDVYNTWYNWVQADDPEGTELRYQMEKLGTALLEAGFIVEPPIPAE